MKIPNMLHKVLCLACAIAAGLAMLLQVLAYAASYAADANYFDRGAIFPTLAIVFALLSAAAGTADTFLSGADTLAGKDAFRFAALPAALGFAVAGIHLLVTATTTLGIISAILLIFGALYCVLDCIGTKKFGSIAVLIGFATVLGCAGLTGYHYFDYTDEMNAPAKVSLQVALLCAMLFFTGELRCRLGTPAPRMYRMLTAWTLASGAVASVPLLFACLIGKIDRIDYLSAAILVLGITATASIRFACLCRREHAPETAPTDSII